MKTINLYIIFLITCLLFQNCTVQKRHHQKGYYVCWNKKSSKTDEQKTVKIEADKPKEIINKVELQNEEPLFVSNDKLNNNLVSPRITLPTDSCGDMITMRDGSDLKVKVIEISHQLIKYKRCDMLDGPLFSVSVGKVFMIKYPNGTKEVFKESENNEATLINKPHNYVEPRYNSLAIASFICGFFSFLIFTGIAAIVLGIVALEQFKSNPGKYKGKWMAWFWIIVSLVGIAILLILLLLVILGVISLF
jgi:hypothetical protein